MSKESVETPTERGTQSVAAISMEWTNYSKDEFLRGAWGWSLEDGFGSLDTSPGPTLAANSGYESMSASQILSGVDTGPYLIWLTWSWGNQSDQRFGIQLYVPFQMFTIGKAPYWYTALDTQGMGPNEPSWTLSGTDPSFPYTWPTSVGYNIVARPTATHTSLDVQVTIQDLKPGDEHR